MADQYDKTWLCGNCGMVNVKGSIECSGCGGLACIVKDIQNFQGHEASRRDMVRQVRRKQETQEGGG